MMNISDFLFPLLLINISNSTFAFECVCHRFYWADSISYPPVAPLPPNPNLKVFNFHQDDYEGDMTGDLSLIMSKIRNLIM